MIPTCFFAHRGDCDGRLVKAHLIPKQRIKRDARFPNGLVGYDMPNVVLHPVVWDPRCWTWMCGGPTGLGGHHGAFDAKQIRIRRSHLPEGVEEFAREYGLEWSLERDYGLEP